MKLETDSLEICPRCQAMEACYITPLNETHKRYFCWNCGFNTTDFMREGEFDFEEIELAMPQLYIDLKSTDREGRVWYPSTISFPDKGTVFINGKSMYEWEWAGILAKELSPEEQELPVYKGRKIKYISDPTTLKHFGTDFIEAADYVGIFKM